MKKKVNNQNILFVFPSINAGGAEKASIYIANYFNNLSVSVSIFIFNKSTHYKSIINPNINVEQCSNTYLKIPILKNIINPIKSYLFFPIKVLQFSFKNKTDSIISIHEYFSEWAVIWVYLIDKLLFRKRNYYSIIQASITDQGKFHFNGANRIIFLLINYLRTRVFTKIFCVSSIIHKQITSSNKQIIFNPIDILKITDADLYNLSDDSINNFIDNKKFVINLSRISPQKNLLLFLKVVNKLKNNLDYKFIILGEITDINYCNKLQEYIDNNNLSKYVKIFEPINNPYYLIKNAEFHLFTSFYEGMPLALLETMYLETVVISTRFIGHETFMSDQNSILANIDDPDDLIEKIGSFINNEYDTENIKKSAKEMTKRFDINNVGKKYLDAIYG